MASPPAEDSSCFMVLETTDDRGQTVSHVVDERVILSSKLLVNVGNFCSGSSVPVQVKTSIMFKIIEFLNHYDGPSAPVDREFETHFFSPMTRDGLSEFTHAANYMEIERISEAGADFIVHVKLGKMTYEQMGQYLGVKDDFTPEQRSEMGSHPVEYFSGLGLERRG